MFHSDASLDPAAQKVCNPVSLLDRGGVRPNCRIITVSFFSCPSSLSNIIEPHSRLSIWRFYAATRGGVAEWSPPRLASRSGHAAAPMPPLAPAPGHEQDC
jgi:hypothetical protein